MVRISPDNMKDERGYPVFVDVVGRGEEKYVLVNIKTFQGVRRAPSTYEVKLYKLKYPGLLDMFSRDKIDGMGELRAIVEPISKEDMEAFKKIRPILAKGETSYRGVSAGQQITDDTVTQKNIELRIGKILESLTHGRMRTSYIQSLEDDEKGVVNRMREVKEELLEQRAGKVNELRKCAFDLERAKEDGDEEKTIEFESDIDRIVAEIFRIEAKIRKEMKKIYHMNDKAELRAYMNSGKRRYERRKGNPEYTSEEIQEFEAEMNEKIAKYKSVLGNTGKREAVEASYEEVEFYRMYMKYLESKSGEAPEMPEYAQSYEEWQRTHEENEETLTKAEEEKKQIHLNHLNKKKDETVIDNENEK
ncbi:MAG: hypothetical protein E7310_08595 [Clostridiales bacterium]|nr:hypothetical protein [Clostridiales bacterium]